MKPMATKIDLPVRIYPKIKTQEQYRPRIGMIVLYASSAIISVAGMALIFSFIRNMLFS